jgi:hypothetical protein
MLKFELNNNKYMDRIQSVACLRVNLRGGGGDFKKILSNHSHKLTWTYILYYTYAPL